MLCLLTVSVILVVCVVVVCVFCVTVPELKVDFVVFVESSFVFVQ